MKWGSFHNGIYYFRLDNALTEIYLEPIGNDEYECSISSFLHSSQNRKFTAPTLAQAQATALQMAVIYFRGLADSLMEIANEI